MYPQKMVLSAPPGRCVRSILSEIKLFRAASLHDICRQQLLVGLIVSRALKVPTIRLTGFPYIRVERIAKCGIGFLHYESFPAYDCLAATEFETIQGNKPLSLCIKSVFRPTAVWPRPGSAPHKGINS